MDVKKTGEKINHSNGITTYFNPKLSRNILQK